MLQEVHDMASAAIREPPSSPSQIVAHVADQGARGFQRGARRHSGRGGCSPVTPAPQRQEHVDPHPIVVERSEGSGGGQHYIDSFDSPHLDMLSYSLGLTLDPKSLPRESGTSQMPPAPSSGFTAFQSPNPSAYEFGRFSAPPPPGTAGASTPHQPISQDALGRGHRVGKKSVRFTPSDWP
ncbi:hypothetical protein M9H77_02661 [Catharanthus roseus]|uniref:Uncharacterized protein n=1 Tax=Catharanthus roseus TaxID=4058 RepID=A0ACC0C9J0_CATRO|nr:hypothetical protein M9H77_02661 [Catharanthus roseus]